MSPSDSQPANNGAKQLNWPTLILVLLTGGGSLLTGLGNRGQIDYGRETVIRQVGDLHSMIDDFEKRQKLELDAVNEALKNQQQMLQNQKRILESLQNK